MIRIHLTEGGGLNGEGKCNTLNSILHATDQWRLLAGCAMCYRKYIISLTPVVLAALVHAVYTEYARYLHGLGLKKAAYFFANKAGPKARQLIDGL